MLNINYLLHPSCCAYFCLKKIDKKMKLKRKKMMSIKEVESVLKENKYNVKSYYLDELEVNKVPYLTLIKRRSYHYLILNNVKEGIVYYYDPLFIHLKKQKINKFIKKWSGIAIFYFKNS